MIIGIIMEIRLGVTLVHGHMDGRNVKKGLVFWTHNSQFGKILRKIREDIISKDLFYFYFFRSFLSLVEKLGKILKIRINTPKKSEKYLKIRIYK